MKNIGGATSKGWTESAPMVGIVGLTHSTKLVPASLKYDLENNRKMGCILIFVLFIIVSKSREHVEMWWL